MIGSAILRKFRNLKYKNIYIKTKETLDLRDQSKVYKYIKRIKPDAVIIAAAKVGGINANNNFRGEFIFDNLSLQNNLTYASFKSYVKNLIFWDQVAYIQKIASNQLKKNIYFQII